MECHYDHSADAGSRSGILRIYGSEIREKEKKTVNPIFLSVLPHYIKRRRRGNRKNDFLSIIIDF